MQFFFLFSALPIFDCVVEPIPLRLSSEVASEQFGPAVGTGGRLANSRGEDKCFSAQFFALAATLAVATFFLGL